MTSFLRHLIWLNLFWLKCKPRLQKLCKIKNTEAKWSEKTVEILEWCSFQIVEKQKQTNELWECPGLGQVLGKPVEM